MFKKISCLFENDFIDYIATFNSRLTNATDNSDHTQVFHLLQIASGSKAKIPINSKPASSVFTNSNQLTTNIVETKAAFRYYFSNLFCADRKKFEDVVSKHVETKNSSNNPSSVILRDEF